MRKFKNKCLAMIMALTMMGTAFAPISLAYDSGAENNVRAEETVQSESIDSSSLDSAAGNNSVESISSEDAVSSDYAKSASGFKAIYGNDRYETAVKVSQEGWSNGADTVIVVNGKNTIMGLIATPLATTYNAPILLADENSVKDGVLNELKRLKPKNIYIIGDRSHISKQVSDKMKNATGANVLRIFGKYPGEVSANVAQQIASARKTDTAYVVSITNGVADALSIASQAGETKNPVIVVDKNYINTQAMSFIKKNISNVYYIGGEQSISSSLIGQIGSGVQNGGLGNRISGASRHATNVSVVDKFYSSAELPAVVITKSDNFGLIDTVCAGPFAAMYKAPIIITEKGNVPDVTKGLLDARKTNTIYQIGGGISAAVTNTVKEKLKEINKTQPPKPAPQPPKPAPQPAKPAPQPSKPDNSHPGVVGSIKGKKIVIDPGHGGSDTGAVGMYGVREKDWTLKTALSCADYLSKAGANVLLTRTGDTYPTLPDRANLSNSQNADFFCSIHYNKGGNPINPANQEFSGTGVEVYKGDGGTADSTARSVLNSILSVFGLKNRGVKDGTHLYVIRNTNAPAILVEGGFVSNRKDVGLLNNDNALKKMGIQIAKGIISAFTR